jgi:hypothetical protein
MFDITDLAQQLKSRLVAGIQSPGGEADQVGEEDGNVYSAATETLRSRESLPCV